jgi:hypothetical protein
VIISVNDYCCGKKLIGLAVKCGFLIFEGKNHTKIKNQKGMFVTTIPRHNCIKRRTAEGIIKALIQAGANIELNK